MPATDPIDFPTEADKKAALEEFDAEMRAAKARLKSVSPRGARFCSFYRYRISSHWLEHRRGPALASFRLELVEWMAPCQSLRSFSRPRWRVN
jgi:hypothetical protein